jgi:predicted ribosomally synthesized peptide with SipW-like signal peptide
MMTKTMSEEKRKKMISKMPKLQMPKLKSLFKSRRSALLIISCALLLAIGITLAWFTSNTTILNGRLELGALNVNLTVYKYDMSDNTLHPVLAEGEDPSASCVHGIIDEQNLRDETTGIRFIEVHNEGNIDAKTFLKFVCTAHGIDESALNYVYLRVRAITSQVTGTLGDFAAVHHTAADASVIAADPESKTLIEMKTDQKIGDILSGETKYYALEYCCSGMPTTYVDSLQTASVDIDAVLNVKQINAPDFEEEETGATFYPRDTESFIAYVSQATDGDTITLTDSIELPANYNLTFLRRVNLNLNGYSLTVHGNLAYDTANFGKCTLNVSGTSRLNIDGSLTIDTPNANFEIRGSSTRAIVLGKWDGVSDTCTGGEFEVNALRDPVNDGYVQTNVNIIKRVYDTGAGAVVNVPAPMSLRSNTKVKIVGSVTGDIIAPAGTNNVWIESSGEIGFIDLSGMVAVGNADNQIYVLNSNTFTNKYPAILLPEWASGAVSTGNS